MSWHPINIRRAETVTQPPEDAAREEAERVLRNAELMAALVDWLFIERDTRQQQQGPAN